MNNTNKAFETYGHEWERALSGTAFDAVLNALNESQRDMNNIYNKLRAAHQYGPPSAENIVPVWMLQLTLFGVLQRAAKAAYATILEEQGAYVGESEKAFIDKVVEASWKNTYAEMESTRKSMAERQNLARDLMAKLSGLGGVADESAEAS